MLLRIPFGQYRQLRERLAVEAAGKVISLLAASRDLIPVSGAFTIKCRCPNPAHKAGSERNASFHFSEVSGRYFCFSCSAHGNSFDLIDLLGGDGDLVFAAAANGKDLSNLPTRPDIRPMLVRGVTDMTRKLREHLEKCFGTLKFKSELAWTNQLFRRLDSAEEDLGNLGPTEIRGCFMQMEMELYRRRL